MSEVFSSEQLERAEKLVGASRVIATSSYVPLLDKFPEVESIAESNLLEYWDSLLSVAGVGVAFMELCNALPEKDQPGMSFAIKHSLNNWKSGAYDELVGLLNYVDFMNSKGVDIASSIGGWVWLNLEKNESSNSKLKQLASSLKLVKTTGLFLINGFHNWWTQYKDKQ